MAVSKKAEPVKAADIEKVIKRGGKVAVDEADQDETSEVRFSLRIPKSFIGSIDKERKKRVGAVSRNQWILEAIAKHLPKQLPKQLPK